MYALYTLGKAILLTFSLCYKIIIVITIIITTIILNHIYSVTKRRKCLTLLLLYPYLTHCNLSTTISLVRSLQTSTKVFLKESLPRHSLFTLILPFLSLDIHLFSPFPVLVVFLCCALVFSLLKK